MKYTQFYNLIKEREPDPGTYSIFISYEKGDKSVGFQPLTKEMARRLDFEKVHKYLTWPSSKPRMIRIAIETDHAGERWVIEHHFAGPEIQYLQEYVLRLILEDVEFRLWVALPLEDSK